MSLDSAVFTEYLPQVPSLAPETVKESRDPGALKKKTKQQGKSSFNMVQQPTFNSYNTRMKQIQYYKNKQDCSAIAK